MNRLDEFNLRYPQLSDILPEIIKASQTIIDCYKNGGKVLICGNGGSASDSAHIVGELMKGFIKKRPLDTKLRKSIIDNCDMATDSMLDNLQLSLPAINLGENLALNTAFLNDVDPSMLFAQGVMGLGKTNDVFLGITTSGNSGNVVNAAIIAKGLGLKTLCLTGRDGGKISKICDTSIIVPETETFKIQELHLPIYHLICILVEEEFFKE